MCLKQQSVAETHDTMEQRSPYYDSLTVQCTLISLMCLQLHTLDKLAH